MKSKIAHKLIIAIVLFSSLITLIISTFQLYTDYRADIKRVNSYETLIRKSYLRSITTSLWNFDDNQIEIQINGLLHLPDMDQIEIESVQGHAWVAGTKSSKHNKIEVFPLSYHKEEKDVPLGVLRAVIGLDGIYSRLFKRALTILVSNAIKTFLVSGFALLLFQFLITQHLYSLSHWLKNLDIGKSFEKFQIDRKTGRSNRSDELDEVVSAINAMQDNLQNYLHNLTKSEKIYEILTENIPLKVFHKDKESTYVACNGSFAKYLGIEADRIAGKTDFDFFPSELAEQYRLDDRRIITSNRAESFEEQYIDQHGQRSVVRTIKAPIRDENNKVVGILGAFIDVTELRLAKKALQESEEKFRRLIESLKESHFFYSHNAIGDFTYVSPSITVVLGYDEKDFLINYRTYLTDNPINEKAVRHTELSSRGVKQPPYELEVLHKDGSTRKLEVTEAPVFDDNEHVIAVEGLAHDVTEIKRLESQLRQSQKMEAIGTLAGGIAHDFNNILSVIMGYTEIAMSETSPGTILHGQLGQVIEAANKAKDLVERILAFSRQSDAKPIPFQPASIVKEAIKMLRHSIPSMIEIHEDIDPNCGLILMDPTQLHQILMNLCTNAFHSMERTGGRMVVSLKNRDVGLDEPIDCERAQLHGNFVELGIEDTGSGIDPVIQNRIFDPYFTTKELGKGTGMGLSIVYGIVESCGGSITVESVRGKGTTFRVSLPVTRQKPEKEQSEEALPKGSERILFVDDEASLVAIGRNILNALGYEVTTRQNSADALQVFREQPDQFDLVITDQTMPGMTGEVLSTKLMEIRPEIPIILCTGYSALISKERAKAIGIREFVLKPLTMHKISKLIRRVLDAS